MSNSPLPPKTLQRLRQLLLQLQQNNTTDLPLDEVIALSQEMKTEYGLTIDLVATKELGQPMERNWPTPSQSEKARRKAEREASRSL